jgi:hypothetical protein
MRRIDHPAAVKDDGDTTGHDHVVVVARTLRHRAICSCGWEAGRRMFLDAAKFDALIHSGDTGHFLADPLVVWRLST